MSKDKDEKETPLNNPYAVIHKIITALLIPAMSFLYNEIKDTRSEIKNAHSEIKDVRIELYAFKEDVAKTFATKEDIKEMHRAFVNELKQIITVYNKDCERNRFSLK